MKSMHAILTGLAILVATLALSELGSRFEKSAQLDPIKVGVVYALTGPAAVWGEYGRKAALLAVEEINSSGGIMGRPLELIFEDSATQPLRAVAAYQKLVHQNSVVAVVGDVWAMLTNPLVPLAEQDKLLLISPTVVDSSVERRSLSFFTMGAQIDSATQAVNQFFNIHSEVKSIAIFGWDDSWGSAYTKLWKRVANERGITVVAEFYTADFFHDYRSEVAIALSKHPDAILIAEGQEPILKTIATLHTRLPILSTSGIVTAHAQGLINDSLVEGIYFTDWVPNSAFVEKFRLRYGTPPLFESFRHYEAIKSIASALKRSPENPLGNIREVRFDGVAGRVDFSQNFAAHSAAASLCSIKQGRPECYDFK